MEVKVKSITIPNCNLDDARTEVAGRVITAGYSEAPLLKVHIIRRAHRHAALTSWIVSGRAQLQIDKK